MTGSQSPRVWKKWINLCTKSLGKKEDRRKVPGKGGTTLSCLHLMVLCSPQKGERMSCISCGHITSYLGKFHGNSQKWTDMNYSQAGCAISKVFPPNRIHQTRPPGAFPSCQRKPLRSSCHRPLRALRPRLRPRLDHVCLGHFGCFGRNRSRCT